MKKILFLLFFFLALSSCSARLSPAKIRIQVDDPQEEFQSLPPETWRVIKAEPISIGLATLIAGIAAATGALGVAGVNAAVNKKQWQEQNEYNTPGSQMERYRAAGLNPNLIYGNGATSAGNAGAIAPFHADAVGTNDLLNIANSIAALKSTDANARKANAEAIGVELNNALRSTQLQYYGSSMDLENRLKAANLDFISGKTDQLGYQNAVYQAQAQNILENALYTKKNREVFQPALIAISRQNAATAANRLNWDMNAWNPLNVMRTHQGNILGKDYQYYDSDRIFNRRTRALGAAVGAVGAGGLLLKGLFSGRSKRGGSALDYYGDWNPSF